MSRDHDMLFDNESSVDKAIREALRLFLNVPDLKTQPTYDAETGNRTRATLVGGERSHHCAIPAPPLSPNALNEPYQT